jgi:hypothetical protein
VIQKEDTPVLNEQCACDRWKRTLIARESYWTSGWSSYQSRAATGAGVFDATISNHASLRGNSQRSLRWHLGGDDAVATA